MPERVSKSILIVSHHLWEIRYSSQYIVDQMGDVPLIRSANKIADAVGFAVRFAVPCWTARVMEAIGVKLSSEEQLPYVMGLVRQSFERQMGDNGDS